MEDAEGNVPLRRAFLESELLGHSMKMLLIANLLHSYADNFHG